MTQKKMTPQKARMILGYLHTCGEKEFTVKKLAKLLGQSPQRLRYRIAKQGHFPLAYKAEGGRDWLIPLPDVYSAHEQLKGMQAQWQYS